MAESDVLVGAAAPTDEIGEQMETQFFSCEVPAQAMENPGPVTTVEGGVVDRMTSAEEERRAYRLHLLQLQTECRSIEEYETARTKSTFTEVACTPSESVDGASSVDPESLHENQLYFQHLVDTCPPHPFPISLSTNSLTNADFYQLLSTSPFFMDFGGRLEVGDRIAQGGQAGIYEAVFDGQVQERYVLKVFELADSSLAELQRQWVSEIARNFTKWNGPGEILKGKSTYMTNGTLLKDGSFAFVMHRLWGDLREAIDNQLVNHQGPPFPLPMSLLIMLQIALGMKELHAHGILHRDLKAANVLLMHDPETTISRNLRPLFLDKTECLIADFETCEGVMGTGFWRAPEVLKAVKNKMVNKETDPEIWTEKVDVYSYAMTCYEVLNGCIPFRKRVANDYTGVIDGERPPLPDYVDLEVQELLGKCWHSEPTKRPTFEEIKDELGRYIEKRAKSHGGLGEDGRDAEAWKNLVSFYKRNTGNKNWAGEAFGEMRDLLLCAFEQKCTGAGSVKGQGRRGRRGRTPKRDLGQDLPGFVRSDNHSSVAVIDTLAVETRSDAIQ